MARHIAVLGATLFALFVALPSSLADAVSPPPSSCPPNTHPVTGHEGTGCAPDHCPLGSEGGICAGGRGCCKVPLCTRGIDTCNPGQACTEVRLCVTPGKFPSRRWSGRFSQEATGYCGESTGCPAGSTCEIVATCITSSTGAISLPGRRTAACSCDLSAGDSLSSLPFFAGACALALGARRRRDRRC